MHIAKSNQIMYLYQKPNKHINTSTPFKFSKSHTIPNLGKFYVYETSLTLDPDYTSHKPAHYYMTFHCYHATSHEVADFAGIAVAVPVDPSRKPDLDNSVAGPGIAVVHNMKSQLLASQGRLVSHFALASQARSTCLLNRASRGSWVCLALLVPAFLGHSVAQALRLRKRGIRRVVKVKILSYTGLVKRVSCMCLVLVGP
jgi:hypothetical protein